MKKVLSIFLAMTLALGLAACGSGNEQQQEVSQQSESKVSEAVQSEVETEEETYTICWISRNLSDLYSAWCYSALQQVVEEKYPNVEIKVMDMVGDYTKVVDLMDNAISMDVDCIMGQFNCNVDITPQVEAAWDAGIPCICVNYMVYDDTKSYAQIGTDGYEMGKLIGTSAAETLPENAQICLLNGPYGEVEPTLRRDGIAETLAELRPDVTILDEQDAQFKNDVAMAKMEDWLQVYGADAIDGVLCSSDSMAIGAIEAYRSAGIDFTDVIFYGLDGLGPAVTSIMEGGMTGSVCKSAIDAVSMGMDYFYGYMDGTYEISKEYEHPSSLINLVMIEESNVQEWFDYYTELDMME